MCSNGYISLLDLSWRMIIGNLCLFWRWSVHVYLTAFVVFTLSLPPAIHAFQVVSKEHLLKPKLDYVMPELKLSWSLASNHLQNKPQTLTQHPQKPG